MRADKKLEEEGKAKGGSTTVGSKTQPKGNTPTPTTTPTLTPTPTPIPIKPTEKKACVPFEDFWEVWPHKVAKAPAQRRWAQMKVDGPLLAKMTAAIELAEKSDKWKEGIIPNPATWLHDERWTDEIADPDAARKAQMARVFGGNQ